MGEGAPEVVQRFIEALGRAEETGSTDELLGLFSDEAQLRSLVHEEPMRGLDGARRFWREYLGSFRELRSRFERISVADGLAVLEWVTDGTLASGAPVTYRGVSLLSYEDGRVCEFRTYYDSAALGGRHRAAR